MLQRWQQTATPRESGGQEPLLLRTFGSASLVGPRQKRIDRLSRYLARAIERNWLGDACPSEWRRLERTSEDESSLGSSSGPCESVETPDVAPISTKIAADEWRHNFGEHASTRFAYEVVSRICGHSALCGAYRTTLLSAKNPACFVELASQAISSIYERVARSPESCDPLSDDDEPIIRQLASSGHRVLSKLIDEIELMSADSPFETAKADRIIKAECVAAIEECLGRQSTDTDLDSNGAIQADARQSLDSADVDMLQCGYDRRTLIVEPLRKNTSQAIDALTQARPTAATVSADIEESVVFCEGSGIQPSSLARGFERVYPGIAEAARRHFTRTDIDWSAWSL
jgi:hypothetical protein